MPKKIGTRIAIEPILTNLKIELKIVSDIELAKVLGLTDSSTISNWKSRGSADFALIFAKCENKNIDWNFVIKGSNRDDLRIKVDALEKKINTLIKTPRTRADPPSKERGPALKEERK